MAAVPQTRRGCQFSLRAFLIACLAMGVGAGLLGRLFVQNRELFMPIFSALSTVVPFLLAIGTIVWIGLRHTPNRRWFLVAWGIALLVMPIAGIGMLYLVWVLAPPPSGAPLSPNQLQSVSTRQLIDQQLPKPVNAPWVWNVLGARLKAGRLSQQDVDHAIRQLVAYMKATQPEGWDGPLQWQGDFVRSAVEAGLISDPVLFDLCDALSGPQPVVHPLPRVREGESGFGIDVNYGGLWGDHSDRPLQLLWDVKQVLFDGEPLEVRQTYKDFSRWSGRHDGTLKAGEHEVSIEFECAYVDRDKLIGLNANELSADRWPKARKRWKQTVSAPLKAYTADEPIVRLTTDPSRNPSRSGGSTIERFVVQADADGKKKIILKLGFNDGLPVSLSYDVAAVFDGQTIELGNTWVVREQNDWFGSPSQLEKQIDTLDPAVKRADVVLTPNPQHIEHRPEVSEIWGEKTIIRGVLIERLDLETVQATEPP